MENNFLHFQTKIMRKFNEKCKLINLIKIYVRTLCVNNRASIWITPAFNNYLPI